MVGGDRQAADLGGAHLSNEVIEGRDHASPLPHMVIDQAPPRSMIGLRSTSLARSSVAS
jgi:hypothetical protein